MLFKKQEKTLENCHGSCKIKDYRNKNLAPSSPITQNYGSSGWKEMMTVTVNNGILTSMRFGISLL